MNTDFELWGRAANCGPMTNLPVLIRKKKSREQNFTHSYPYHLWSFDCNNGETEGLVAETMRPTKSRRFTMWHFTQMAKVWSSMYVWWKGMGEGSKRTTHR